MLLESHVAGRWWTPDDEGEPLLDAATGEEVARMSTRPVPAGEALRHARAVGGPALRALTFPERAALLKALGTHLMAVKDDVPGAVVRDRRDPPRRRDRPRRRASARCSRTPAAGGGSCPAARCSSTGRWSSWGAAAPSSAGTS